MSEITKKCEYRSHYTGWKCPFDALPDSKEGFCIFHERRKDKDINNFRQGIAKILQDQNSDDYHFEGFFFPDSISFKGFQFSKNVYFCEAEFLGEHTDFSNARFTGENTDFGYAKFLGETVDFLSVYFSKGINDFAGTKFQSKHTNLTGAKFLGEMNLFHRTEFSRGNTMFTGATFLGGRTVFYKTIFSGKQINFDWAEFLSHQVNFYYSRFLTEIVFGHANFQAKTNFTGVDLTKCVFWEADLKNVDFYLLEWDWKHKLGDENILQEKILTFQTEEDRVGSSKRDAYFKSSEIYRQLKVQFNDKRDFAKAGMFHFREQECKRMACKLPKDFFKWVFLWILRLSCGYGEKLRNVVLSSIVLVLIFGVFYMFLGLHATDQAERLVFQYKLTLENPVPLGKIISDYLTSVSFSLKGFFPLWRFQQYKLVGDLANLVAGIEFLLGAFFVGLFIYVFRRRMEK